MKEFEKAGFQAKKLYEAYKIWKEMCKKKCTKILTAAGALIPGGMKKFFLEAFEKKLVDVFVTTGAMLTHDLIETFGTKHKIGTEKVNDVELAKKNIDRIYNIFLEDKAYQIFEKRIQTILKKMPQEEYSPSEFLKELAAHIKNNNSIIKKAAEKNIPIFCPAFTDSILGFQTWMFSQENKLKINTQLDIRDFFEIMKRKKYGIIILGGGVPKNFALIMMQVSSRSIDYAIQITTDRPEHGGLSGATLQEAKSWKKISANAKTTEVICDTTIAFPLLVRALTKK